MALVTYRGVKYDTKQYAHRPHETHTVKEMWRGVPHEEKVEVTK